MWLKVAPVEAEVRLLWGNDEGPYEPYTVGRVTLAEACQSVRAELTGLVRSYESVEPGLQARALRNLAMTVGLTREHVRHGGISPSAAKPVSMNIGTPQRR